MQGLPFRQRRHKSFRLPSLPAHLFHRDCESAGLGNLSGAAADGPGPIQHLSPAVREIKRGELASLTEGLALGLDGRHKFKGRDVMGLRPPIGELQTLGCLPAIGL